MANLVRCRNFVHSFGDYITIADGGLVSSWDACTLAAIVQPTDSANIRAIFSGTDPLGFYFGLGSSNELFYNNTSDTVETGIDYATNAMGWMLLAVTKTAGTTTPRAHRYRYDITSWDHQNMNSNIAPPTDPTASTEFYLGCLNSLNYTWHGNIACIGVWAGTALSDGQVETLYNSLDAWKTLSPTGLWLFEQATLTTKVPDLTGNDAYELSRNGTTIVEATGLTFDVPIPALAIPPMRIY